MTIHSPECERYLHQLESAPMDSVEHDMAAYILSLSDMDAICFLLTVMDEDPPETLPAQIAAEVWHLAAQEVEL